MAIAGTQVLDEVGWGQMVVQQGHDGIHSLQLHQESFKGYDIIVKLQ